MSGKKPDRARMDRRTYFVPMLDPVFITVAAGFSLATGAAGAGGDASSVSQ
jgi:hypothetical protein